VVTDDIASGPTERPENRRGVAGDFLVFKVAGAAADRGDDLDGVHAAAVRAKANTRTFGAAFGGCTLPGAEKPLFTVGEREMELGLGIHGEPGVRTVGRLDAAELAELVDGLLPELPAGVRAGGDARGRGHREPGSCQGPRSSAGSPQQGPCRSRRDVVRADRHRHRRFAGTAGR
jgi:dihydroxyacetone kinase